MYPQGYFKQRISAEGWQEEEYQQLDFSKAPVSQILSKTGQKCLVEVKLNNRTLHLGAWLVNLGRVSLYLIDTGLEENDPQDRQLSTRLYTADREQRLKQEIILGIGGVRGVVGTNVSYAPYVELRPARHKVGRMHYMRDAFMEHKERILRTISAAVQKIVRGKK
jgi:starch phosphorylase